MVCIWHQSYVSNTEFGNGCGKLYSLFSFSSISENYNNKELKVRILSVHRIVSYLLTDSFTSNYLRKAYEKLTIQVSLFEPYNGMWQLFLSVSLLVLRHGSVDLPISSQSVFVLVSPHANKTHVHCD